MSRRLPSILLTLLLTLSTTSAQCNTDQNPYCKGNSKLESLCCPYPNVCYWADRQGTPACCPAGQSCQGADGIISVPSQPDQTPTLAPAPTTQQEYTTITSYPVAPTTQGGGTVVVVPTTNNQAPTLTTTVYPGGGIATTVASVYQGVTATVGSVIAGAATTVIQVFNNAGNEIRGSLIAACVTAGGLSLWLFV